MDLNACVYRVSFRDGTKIINVRYGLANLFGNKIGNLIRDYFDNTFSRRNEINSLYTNMSHLRYIKIHPILQ